MPTSQDPFQQATHWDIPFDTNMDDYVHPDNEPADPSLTTYTDRHSSGLH